MVTIYEWLEARERGPEALLALMGPPVERKAAPAFKIAPLVPQAHQGGLGL